MRRKTEQEETKIVVSACSVLFIIYYLLFIIYYLLFIIYYLLFIVYYLLFVSLPLIFRLLPQGRWRAGQDSLCLSSHTQCP